MLNRSRILAALAAVLSLALVLFTRMFYWEPRRLRLRRFRVHLPGLPTPLAGTRIAFLTDFHVNGPGTGDTLTALALDLVAQERPDLVLLGGDFANNGSWDSGSHLFDRLGALGTVFGVLGNHDYRRRGAGPTRIAEELRCRGVRVLRNQSETIELNGQRLTVAGVDDPYTHHDDLSAALCQDGGPRPLLLLAHAPSVVGRLPVGAAGLILAGHTHGGQIRISPWNTMTPLDLTWFTDRIFHRPAQHYVRGFHWVRGGLLFVSAGLGMTRLPFRFMAPPEVALLELVAEPPNPGAPCDSAERYVEELDTSIHWGG